MENNKYIIREIRENEIDEVNKLLNELIIDEKQYDSNINESYIVKDYYQKRQKDSVLLVASLNEKIVGYLFGYVVSAKVFLEDKAMLDALFISSKHRKRGLANLLISGFKKWCLDRKINNIELTVCEKNIDAYELYKKNGFNIEKYTMSAKLK